MLDETDEAAAVEGFGGVEGVGVVAESGGDDDGEASPLCQVQADSDQAAEPTPKEVGHRISLTALSC